MSFNPPGSLFMVKERYNLCMNLELLDRELLDSVS